MQTLLNLFVFIPLFGFAISLLLPSKNEKLISWTASFTAGTHLISFLAFFMLWTIKGFPTLNIKDVVLFKSTDYEFFIDFGFDKITATYLFVGAFLTFLVTIYSSYYLHREAGYKRFFNTILFFYLGYNMVILSGNLETLFIGWEILGISSFLLIAFYRDRYQPVKNAMKVFSIYRIGDVGLILAMWLSHHLWHENVTFLKLSNYELVNSHLQSHSLVGVFISLMILIAAAAKSAQLPFSSWLPRAMEGPTPSSAIFYGSLSVHIGVFVLLRTFPFWEHQLSIRILIGFTGFVTSVIATGIARVQSSVKSQIAYSSIAQIGLIFVEVAAGYHTLALIHFAGNAFLRTYQLLVSPSVVTYLIREQFYNYIPREHTFEDSLPRKIEYTFYMLCLKEWSLDALMYKYLWRPLKIAGERFKFFTIRNVIFIMVPVYLWGLYALYDGHVFSPEIKTYLPVLFSIIGLGMVLRAFAERTNVTLSWLLIILNHFWIALSISYNESFQFDQVHLYLSGIAISGIIGYWVLWKLKQLGNVVDLEFFQGYSFQYSKLAVVFLLSCLGVAGFPITPTFIGEDLIFSHIHEDQIWLVFLTALSFIVAGLAIIRIYSRIFLGPYVKSPNEVAYRSS